MPVKLNPLGIDFSITGSSGGGGVDSVNGQTGIVELEAVDIPYDNIESGLSATDVQDAIDEIVADIPIEQITSVRASFDGGTDINEAESTYDDIDLDIGDLVLLQAQGDQSQNGVWEFDGEGNPLIRVEGWDTASDFTLGKVVLVREGSRYANSLWALKNEITTLGTDNISFQINGFNANKLTSNLIPYINNQLNLGSNGSTFQNIFADGIVTSTIGPIDSSGLTIDVGNDQFELRAGSNNDGLALVSASLGIMPDGDTNPNELRFYDVESENYVGFKAPAVTLAGSTAWTLPEEDGTSGQVLQTDGVGNLSFEDISAVNTTLSNLDTPTAINQDLLPDIDQSRSLGSETFQWGSAYIDTVTPNSLFSNNPIFLNAPNFNPSNDNTTDLGQDGNSFNELWVQNINSSIGINIVSSGAVVVNTSTGQLSSDFTTFNLSSTDPIIETQAQSGSTDSSNLEIRTGEVEDGTSGNLLLGAGAVTGTGEVGEVHITSRSVLAGSQRETAFRIIDAATTLDPKTDFYIVVDLEASNFDINLPPGEAGLRYIVLGSETMTFTVNLIADGSDVFSGALGVGNTIPISNNGMLNIIYFNGIWYPYAL